MRTLQKSPQPGEHSPSCLTNSCLKLSRETSALPLKKTGSTASTGYLKGTLGSRSGGHALGALTCSASCGKERR